ncbi:MAG TPA: sugar phosphate nucleotidyltransferase [Candidatus Paceibacterota bacterium]|nr:sugar phosphate nucleotidyltransferase [Candidatus Paceibacterota bacterium]HMP19148.1 sugar phosphate nucleotidyltransferase [Candidatus Paceibacterota bacterium]HMP85143.1 sugar phosphate nucleotidyltransferase [Candidatus Paceibacterota bacterium]
MKAIILAGGRGKRMGKLTITKPKPLLKYKKDTLIKQKLECVYDLVDEIIIVIGYLGKMIVDNVGTEYKKTPIKYFNQKKLLGTADSLWSTKKYISKNKNEKILILMADDIYSKKDIKKLIEFSKKNKNDWAMLAYKSPTIKSSAKFIVDKKNNFKEIKNDLEGKVKYNYEYTGCCIISPKIFDGKKVKISNGEYGLPQTIANFSKKINIKIFLTKDWKKITSEKDLL